MFEPNNKYFDKTEEIKNKLNENESSFKNQVEDDSFWNSAAAMCIYQSNKIEKINHSINDTTKMIQNFLKTSEREKDLVNLEPENALKRREIIQHYIVLKEIFEKRNDVLNVDNIIKWHSILMKDIIPSAGAYRTEDVFAGQRIFISHTLVKESISSLVERYNRYRESLKPTPYAISAWLSHAFVSIHPFLDGNGRMCRLLGNLVMFSYGFPFPIPISGDKGEYLKALRLADRDYETGRNTSHLAFIFLDSSNAIYNNYLSNINLSKEFNKDD